MYMLYCQLSSIIPRRLLLQGPRNSTSAESNSPGSAERGQKHTPAPNRDGAQVSDVQGIAQAHGTVPQLGLSVLAESSSHFQ